MRRVTSFRWWPEVWTDRLRRSSIRGGRVRNLAAVTIGVVLIAAASQAQTCLHGPDESAYQRARRDAAIRFVQQVNDAENILRLKRGKFGHLDELSGIGSPPVGFVPKVTVDGWNYTVVVKDFFDDCG